MNSVSNLKIAFFVRELSNVMGGMERQMLTIAQSLTELGHAVTVISLDEGSPLLFYSNLAKGIDFLNVPSGNPSEKQNIASRINRQSRVYQRIKEEKYDVSVAFMTGAYWYSRIPTLLCGVPLILAERNAPSIYKLTRVRKIRGILFLSMFFSAAMTIQFPRYALQYPFYLRHKIHVIPNIVERSIQEKPKAKSKITFVFAGRFSYQKQPLLLLRAFLEFSRNRPDVELLLFGKGDLKSEMLEILSTSPNSSCITIANPTQSAKDFLQTADVLCIPSIWEGFPNVLAEALSAGIPALGFSNCDGVSDLIQNGVNGWTIESDGTVEPLLSLLEVSYTGIKEKQISTQNCSDSVLAYEKTRVAKQWEDLLLRLSQ